MFIDLGSNYNNKAILLLKIVRGLAFKKYDGTYTKFTNRYTALKK